MTRIFETLRHLALMVCVIGMASAVSAQTDRLMLNKGDLVPKGPLGWEAPEVTLPAVDKISPIVVEWSKEPGTRLLRHYAARGEAAGFEGLLYDNRDGGHSLVPWGMFPRLGRIVYAPSLEKEQLNTGLGGSIILPAIVLGNSSTAITGSLMQRSLPRWAMTRPGLPERSYHAYSSNHLYVYPEHRDHDDVDMFPAQWPYTVISQGSSTSDQPFIQALIMTAASFTSETRDKLVAQGLVAPTLQMILRRTLAGTRSREIYLSPKAHPTAFDRRQLSVDRMVALAHGLSPDEIPPMVRLKVLSEEFETEAGLGQMTEHLYDTPSAIARIWRGDAWRREMTVSAAETKDPNGRDLSYTWVVLRGDPSKVTITPLDDRGREAKLSFTWQDAQPAAVIGGSAQPILSRIDIGVFAWNGKHDSAPAVISVSYPTHEQRRYAKDSDGVMQLVEVDYDAAAGKRPYDPALHWTAPWRDQYVSDGSRDTGWWRFDKHGAHLLTPDATRPQAEYHLTPLARHSVLNEGPYPDG